MPFPFVEEVRSFRSAEALRHPKSNSKSSCLAGWDGASPVFTRVFVEVTARLKPRPFKARSKSEFFCSLWSRGPSKQNRNPTLSASCEAAPLQSKVRARVFLQPLEPRPSKRTAYGIPIPWRFEGDGRGRSSLHWGEGDGRGRPSLYWAIWRPGVVRQSFFHRLRVQLLHRFASRQTLRNNETSSFDAKFG